MGLPVDPRAVDPDDSGAEQAVPEMAHDGAVEYVREALFDRLRSR